jgi:hypothetical protein
MHANSSSAPWSQKQFAVIRRGWKKEEGKGGKDPSRFCHHFFFLKKKLATKPVEANNNNKQTKNNRAQKKEKNHKNADHNGLQGRWDGPPHS